MLTYLSNLRDAKEHKGCKRALFRLKHELTIKLMSVLPGYIRVIDNIARTCYDSSIIELLLSKPSKLYSILIEYYGDEMSADLVFHEVFLRPLAKLLKHRIAEHELLTLIKKGEDGEALATILKIFLSRDKQDYYY